MTHSQKVNCSKCQQPFLVSLLPFCSECQNYIDNCQHAITCPDCSLKIIWSNLGKIKINTLTNFQIKEIQKSILKKFQQEVYVDKNHCLQIKNNPPS